MTIPDDSPWLEHPDAFQELVSKVNAVGLTVVLPEGSVFCDAQVVHGRHLISWVHYDPAEEEWGAEDHGRFLTPLDDIVLTLERQRPEVRLVVEYPRGEVPEIPAQTVEAIKKLLPGNPVSVGVRYPVPESSSESSTGENR